MKLHFDIDCTPEELRDFFGLPEVKPMQDRLVAELEERMRANLKALDPETMIKTWLPAGLKGFRAAARDVLQPDGPPEEIGSGNNNGVRDQDTASPAAPMARQ
jgi:hypothetical protein